MKNNQQNNENVKVYTAGEVGSLLESINDGIKIIAEDQASMKKDIRDIKEKLDEIENKLDTKAGIEVIDRQERRIIKLEKAVAI